MPTSGADSEASIPLLLSPPSGVSGGVSREQGDSRGPAVATAPPPLPALLAGRPSACPAEKLRDRPAQQHSRISPLDSKKETHLSHSGFHRLIQLHNEAFHCSLIQPLKTLRHDIFMSIDSYYISFKIQKSCAHLQQERLCCSAVAQKPSSRSRNYIKGLKPERDRGNRGSGDDYYINYGLKFEKTISCAHLQKERLCCRAAAVHHGKARPGQRRELPR